MSKLNFLDFTLKDLSEHLVKEGFTTFNGKQVFDWIYKKFKFDIDEWTNISKSCRAYLSENFELYLPKVIWHGLSKDGTRKFLVQMHDKLTVETVVIPSGKRLTQCVSSQVGCAIGCTFCHTGTQGLKRHLTAGEIVGQYLGITLWLHEHANGDERMTNIVYMGQGEPLHNYKNVKKATEVFLDDHAFGLSQRKVTLSTSGLVPKIKMLHDFPPVNIAISLHSAIDDNRSELMPINKTYDLKRLFAAIQEIPLKAHRRITYEYLLIDTFNDTMEDVEALTNLLKVKESKINLIPFNEYPGSNYKRPTTEKVLWFMDQMTRRGYTCTVRATKGDDILAACGQLKTQYELLNTWDNNLEIQPRTSRT